MLVSKLAVVEVPVLSYPDLAATIGKYSDREVDFADASLVWLAERSGLRRILKQSLKQALPPTA